MRNRCLRISFGLKGPGNAHYLCNEIGTYISSEEVKGNDMEGMRKQIRTELRICLIDVAVI